MVVIGAWTDADKGVGVGAGAGAGAGGGAGQQTPMESGNIPPCPCLGVPNLIGVPSFPIFKISFICSLYINKQKMKSHLSWSMILAQGLFEQILLCGRLTCNSAHTHRRRMIAHSDANGEYGRYLEGRRCFSKDTARPADKRFVNRDD